MTDLLRWGSVSFPDKQLFWERATSGLSYLSRHRRPTAVAAAAAVGLAVCGVATVGYVRLDRLVTAQQVALAHTETANADLQEALARLRDQFGAANQSLGAARRQLTALNAASEQAATSKTDRITQLTHTLDQLQRDLHLAEAQRVTLMARLSKAEVDLAEGQSRQKETQSGLEQWQKKIQQLTAERDKVASERDHLRARVSELEARLPQSQSRQPTRPTAAAVPPAAAPQPAAATPAVAAAPQAAPAVAAAPQPAPAAPAVAAAPQPAAAAPVVAVAPAQPAAAAPAVAALPSHAASATPGGLVQVERVLASAGVDVGRLFAHYGMRTGEGGPFVPVPRDGKIPTMSQDQLTALSRLAAVLPVSAPLASYRLGSPFGVRGDPMNGRHEFHTGIDMLAPYMTPVYATAPGVVTYAGYRDDYGKIVEIDHGNGISTRYAHLHRYLVSVGERVTAHSQIGFLGSSGRATGPHVHYEVLVNGEPQDPEKFLGLARVVAVAQH